METSIEITSKDTVYLTYMNLKYSYGSYYLHLGSLPIYEEFLYRRYNIVLESRYIVDPDRNTTVCVTRGDNLILRIVFLGVYAPEAKFSLIGEIFTLLNVDPNEVQAL